MPTRPMPRAVKRTAVPLPALLAPVVFAALSGCAVSLSIVDDPRLSDHGAHYVDAKWRGADFQYEIGSALPGAMSPVNSAPVEPHSQIGYMLERTVEYVAHSLQLPVALRATVTAHPLGVRAVVVRRHEISKGEPIEITIAVRHVAGDDRYDRGAVRRLAHEAAHVISAYHRVNAADEEWAATVMESCAEMAIFGNTKGFVFDDELATPLDSFSRSQATSTTQALAAIRQVREEMRTNEPGRFRQLCENAFAVLRPK